MKSLLLAALIFGAAAFPALPATAVQADYVGTYVWRENAGWFGGLSGIEVDDDGIGFTALGDRITLLRGRLQRNGDGVITGVTLTQKETLVDSEGRELSGRRADSEGLAIAPNGNIYISFEGLARVREQDGMTGTPHLLPSHPDFDTLIFNSALEALAIAPDGALYTIPERSGRPDRPFPVYRFRNGTWDIPFTIPRDDSFLNSGADIGPDGKLYVLQRDFTGIGFRSRVLRFDLEGRGGEVVLETSNGTHDNLEGISVWQAPDGLRITMISDNNFRFFQQTQIVEYRIPG
jgi:hypothetical protein